MNKNFDLDIQNYSLKDIFILFGLELPKNKPIITDEDLKKARINVLKMHPDKSKLPSKYFLFYKKAFDILKEFNIDYQKINQDINENNTTYHDSKEDLSEENKQIKLHITNMEKKDFHVTFNKLFEKNMMSKSKENENKWFSDKKKMYESQEGGANNINQNINNIKKIQAQGQLTKFKGIKTFHSMSGTDIYDDLDKNEEEQNEYITCDPYSKLQYEDIRKVHRDETVFRINENDFDSLSVVKSQKELEQIRAKQNSNPINYEKAKQNFDNEEILHNNRITEKQHVSKLKNLVYEEKNKNVLSYFLRLNN